MFLPFLGPALGLKSLSCQEARVAGQSGPVPEDSAMDFGVCALKSPQNGLLLPALAFSGQGQE